MDNRPNLQLIFEELLGSKNVYFQPPESLKMSYPAIRYSLKSFDRKFANNLAYLQKPCYEVTLIDKNPDSEYVEKLLSLYLCNFDRHYKSENFNHWVFTIYY